ncbi:unnamed protein product [Pseudo-nitzschia multistriata]|uniref:Prolyl 4-hydroxylase alpha subunit domain-containing protein n=1 Tax=Pseudo-nitzschia multistriata TaxID=183589 RepID=A0A448ZDX3_9STRA|nr:unnamed protein product [Pseudo-nitzschia multistriata]
MERTSNQKRTTIRAARRQRGLPAVLLLLAAMAMAIEFVAADKGDPPGGEGVCETEAETKTGARTRPPPRVLLGDTLRDLEDLVSFEEVLLSSGARTPAVAAAVPGGEAIGLTYVRDLVEPGLSSRLVGACDARSGWTVSPQSVDGSATVREASRTSRSCPLIWPQLYLPLLDDPAYASRLDPLREEIGLAWGLTQRFGDLLGVGEETVEPLQLVRYRQGEFYKEHHDHGSYYGADTEQRPWTLLVYLSDAPGGGERGGQTFFRALGGAGGVSVVPRRGDGVLWRNEDAATGELLEEAVHEAVPPEGGTENEHEHEHENASVKYAMNVWIAKKKIMEHMDVSAYRTQ